MFHSKQDVDRYVSEVFRNIKSEYQRNLKCYQIAKLYYKFKDYKAAIKYINRYILTTSNSAAAHRLLGECYLGINLKVKALDSFKTSLELNGSQNELVLKVCSLLMDPEVSAVTPRATYWLERAESLFPTNPVVFRLREQLLKSNPEEKQDSGQLEKLILSEISARPTDVTVRIRLLNFFVDTKRFKIAYQHALEIEERNNFSNDLRWYDCLCNLVQAYEKSNSELGFSFFIKKIIFFEKRADLYMQEFQDEVKTLPECSVALFAFDQNLHLFSKIDVPREEVYFFNEFLKHMKAQLAFHLATLALKRAQKEYGIWPKTFCTASPLLLLATQTTMDTEDAWYNMWNGKNKMERDVLQLSRSAALRISQAGHVLLAWSQSNGPKFLEKVSQFCGGKWQTYVYQNIFYNKDHRQATATSHFINDSFFANVPMRLLTESELTRFDEVSQSAYPDSLHHLVWLGLSYCNSNGQLSHDFRCMTVPELQFTVENLSQFGPETLNQLDVDAFLYASVICAKSASPSSANPHRPSRLPVSISEELCSTAQSDWWVAVYKTYKNQPAENIGDRRLKLRRGIETIRAFGQHGLHVKVLVMLAKLFQERAAKNKNPNELSGLEERAHLYWTAAVPLLERVEKNQQLREVPNRLFDYRGKDLTPNEIKGYLEDGRLFLACRLMKQGRHEQAIEAFQLLKSPYATFYQGLIYEKLASEEVSHRPESITSENRSQHIILLTRARDAFYLTLDRLRCPSVDSNHPLNAQLQDHLEQIEKQLGMIDPDIAIVNRNGDSESDETDTVPGPLSPDVDENLDASFNIYNTSNFFGMKNHLAPRGKLNFSEKHHNTRFEARPSPERLDAQLRHLVQTHSNGMHTMVEILKDIKSVLQIEFKDLRCVTRDLLAEMKRFSERLEASRRDAIKPEDILELREEDYEDLSQLSQYASYPNYQINRPMPPSQATSVNYGTSVPSPVPPVPPVVPISDAPLIPPSFYPGMHPVPPIDPSVLLYQTLGYYAQGMPGYGENQNLPDYRGTGIQKGAPFVKNAYKAPDPAVSTNVVSTKPQPPNVVITSSDTLPAFTTAGTPAMSVTVPFQHIRGMMPSPVAQKPIPGQVHPYQIQMPPQAQLVKESPTEKLDSIVTTTSPFTNSIQTPVVSTKESSPKDTPKTAYLKLLEEKLNRGDQKPDLMVGDESRLFESRGKLSVKNMTGDDKDWKDIGVVLVSVLSDNKQKKVRIVLFQEHLRRVYVEHYMTPDMELELSKASDNGVIWTSSSPNKSSQKFSIEFNSFDEAKDFGFAFNEGRKTVKGVSKNLVSKPGIIKAKECKDCKSPVEGNSEKCSSCEAKEKQNQDKTNLGGFTFISSPIVKPPVLKLNEQKEKPKETPKPSPFAEFSFSGTPAATTVSDAITKTSGFINAEKAENTNENPWLIGVKADPNSFKKDANFKGFEGKDSLVFGYLNKPKATPAPAKTEKPSTTKTSTNEEDEDGDDEFVPTAEFTPVVDLPELVDVKTGEENDKVLFTERAKLLRFDSNTKEWKERGVGNMKVLLNEESGRVRLIMRRELVLKVCCNHYLDENIEFKRLTKSEKALTWYAQDYSEGDLKAECFALRFKSPESMMNFEKIIKDTQSKMKDGRLGGTKPKEVADKPKELKPLSEMFKPKAGSWECGTCLIRNNESATKCVSCETPKPGTEPASNASPTPTSGLGKGITFPPTTTTFNFGIPQTAVTTSGTSPAQSVTTSSSAPKFTFGITPASTSPSNFSFGSPSLSTTPGSTPSTANKFFSLGATTTAAPTTTKFTFGTNVTATTTTASTPTFSFGMPTLGVSSTSTTSIPSNAFTFTIGKTSPNTTAPSSTLMPSKPTFSVPSVTAQTTKTEGLGAFPNKPFTFNIPTAEENKSKPESGTPSTFSFTTALKPEGKEKFEFSMSNIKPAQKATPSPKAKPSRDDAASEDSEGEAEEDNGDHIIVTPVVPLPEKVPVHTGEEDEDVLYETRAKLFRFANKEWKERGIGDIKILKHKTNNKIRLLMRRDTILKVCLNHYVTPDIEFTQKDKKSWQWSAADFSEEEVKYSTFAIRFKTPEIAEEFKKVLDDIKNNVIPTIKTEPTEKPKDSSSAIKSFTFAVPNAPKLEAPKGSQSENDDILVVYENKVTPEQREKAMSLHLPPNFYAYLQAPDCPGCAGCEKDDAPDQNKSTPPPDSTTPMITKPIFGCSPWGSLSFGGSDNSEGKVMFTFGGNQAAIKRKPEGPTVTDDAEDDDEEGDDGDEDDEDNDDDDDDEDLEEEDEEDDDEVGSEFEEVGEEDVEEEEYDEDEKD